MVIDDKLLQEYSPNEVVVFSCIRDIVTEEGFVVGDKKFSHVELRKIKARLPNLSMFTIKKVIKTMLDNGMIVKGPSITKRPVLYGVKVK